MPLIVRKEDNDVPELEESSSSQPSPSLFTPVPILPEPLVPTQFLPDLMTLYQQTITTQQGQLIFFTGPQKSGRQALAQKFITQAIQAHPDTAAIELTFLQDEEKRLYLHQTNRPETLNMPLNPEPRQFARSLRQWARQRPLILNIRQLELAYPAWWSVLEKTVFPELAHWPIMILIHLTTPHPLEDIYAMLKGSETSLLALAAYLWARGEEGAEDFFCGDPLAETDIAAYLGQADPHLVERLSQESQGIPAFILALWQSWQNRNLVHYRPTGWQFVQPLPSDETESYIHQHLTSLIPLDFDLEETKEILTYAALEGETFTAEAIAQQIGWDSDDFIDFCDENLCCLDEEGQVLPDKVPFLVESEAIPIEKEEGIFYLTRYRFAQPIFYQFWTHHRSVEKQEISALAKRLIYLYSPETMRIASPLIRLFERADQSEQADFFRRHRAILPDTDTLRWLVELHRREWVEQKGALDLYRVKRFLELIFDLTGRQIQTSEGLTMAQLAREVAQQNSDLRQEGIAWGYMGHHYFETQHYDQALAHYQQAQGKFQQGGNIRELAFIYHDIARTYHVQQQYHQALQWYEQARKLIEQMGDIRQLEFINQRIEIVKQDQAGISES